DIAALNAAAAAPVNRAAAPAAGGGGNLAVPEASMSYAPGAILGQGQVSWGGLTDETVPDNLATLDINGVPTNERVVWGGNLLLDSSLQLGSGDMSFTLDYRDLSVFPWYPNKGVDELTLHPVLYDPVAQDWRPIAGFSGVVLDP